MEDEGVETLAADILALKLVLIRLVAAQAGGNASRAIAMGRDVMRSVDEFVESAPAIDDDAREFLRERAKLTVRGIFPAS